MKKMKKNTIKEIRETKILDANGKTLGRVASEAAMSLMGKTKVTFQRHIYSGIPGGLHILKGAYTAEKKGLKELIKLATYQMLPSNKLRKAMMKNLTIEK